VLGALTSALRHPVSIGAGVGGLGGAGIGYLSADKDDPNRLRKALVGGATGAGAGALIGALSSGGITAEEINAIRDEGIQAGHDIGFREGMATIAKDPAAASDLIGKMSPEVRDLLAERLKKSNWLTRMLGG